MEGLFFCGLGVFEDGRLVDKYVKMIQQMIRYNYLYIRIHITVYSNVNIHIFDLMVI